MGNKTAANWQVVCVSPEGKYEVMASASHVCLAQAAYEEALHQRPGRMVMFVHGSQIIRKEVGRRRDEPADSR